MSSSFKILQTVLEEIRGESLNNKLLDNLLGVSLREGRYDIYKKLAELSDHKTIYAPIYSAGFIEISREWCFSIGHFAWICYIVMANRLGLFSCSDLKVRIHAHKPLIWNPKALQLFNSTEVVFQFYSSEEQYRIGTRGLQFRQSMSYFLLNNGKKYEAFSLFSILFRLYGQYSNFPVLDRTHILLSKHSHFIYSRYPNIAKRFVTIHIRSGWQGINKSEIGRNSDISNFGLSISWLLSIGLTIVRLGDQSMKPLMTNDQQVIDLPFTNNRDMFDDIYFLSNATLHIGTQSGPLDVAGMFGTPLLLAGAVGPAFSTFLPYEPSIYIPKFWTFRGTNQIVPLEKWLISNKMSSSEYGIDDEFDAAICELPASLILLAVQCAIIHSNDPFTRDLLSDVQREVISTTLNTLNVKGEPYLKKWVDIATARGFVNYKIPPSWYFGYIYGSI